MNEEDQRHLGRDVTERHAEACHVEHDGETTEEPTNWQERATELEAQVAELQRQTLDYQVLMDLPNNRLVIQRQAGALVVQEHWDPDWAKEFADTLKASVSRLAGERRKFEAQMRDAAKQAAQENAGGGRTSRLWKPGDPRADAAGPAALAAARATQS